MNLGARSLGYSEAVVTPSEYVGGGDYRTAHRIQRLLSRSADQLEIEDICTSIEFPVVQVSKKLGTPALALNLVTRSPVSRISAI